MRNGMYKYKHKNFNHEVYIKAYCNNITLHEIDSINGPIKIIEYVGPISEEKLKNDYTFVEEVKQNCKWDLVYYAGNVKQSTLVNNGAFAICMAKKKELRRTTHKLGQLIIELHAT